MLRCVASVAAAGILCLVMCVLMLAGCGGSAVELRAMGAEREVGAGDLVSIDVPPAEILCGLCMA
jgi:hypothetical protein